MNKVQLEKDVDFVKSKLPEILTSIMGEKSENDLNFKLVFRENMVSDRYKREGNEIHYGTNNKSLENLKVARKRLVHEAIHAAGIHHNDKMRSMNFYSQLSRDLFTEKIMEKLGWEPPTKAETRKYYREKGKLDYKYVAYCPECGNKWYRKKKSKLIKQPENYYCKKCKANLKSRELTKDEEMEVFEN